MTLRARLLSKTAIDEVTGCWNWTASKRNGYGLIRVAGCSVSVHRLSYELHRGPILSQMVVCHRCDNRACVNPEHLFLGTQADNIADRDAKGRQPRVQGMAHGSAKLTDNDVLAIRASGRTSRRVLAKQYGVSEVQISNVRTGRNWRHLTEEIAGAADAAVVAAKAMVGEG